MSEWAYKKLDEYVRTGQIELGRGNIISKLDIEACPGPYPIYSSSAQGDGKFGEYGKFMFDEELVSWSVDGGGNFFYRPKHQFSVTNVSGFLRIKTKELGYRFLYYSLALQHRDISFDYTTKAHPSVIRKLYSIPSIPKHEQDRIVGVLSTLDETIGQTEALIVKYQQIKAGLMHDLFTRGVTPDGHLRPTREQAPHLYKESPLGWIPKEWEVSTLGESCEWFSGGTPSRSKSEWWSGDFPWLTPKDMKAFELSDTSEHITKEAALFGSRVVSAGTVFIVVRGMILAHSFPVVLGLKDFAFNQDIKAVQAVNRLGSRFLAYWFVGHTDLFLRKTTEATHGTKRFDLQDISKVSIGLPKPDEQNAIVSRLDSISMRIDSEQALVAKLRQKKHGLMHDLLTGRVRVKVAETASI